MLLLRSINKDCQKTLALKFAAQVEFNATIEAKTFNFSVSSILKYWLVRRTALCG